MSRRPPPPGIVAAAEQDYHGMRDALDTLIPTVRALLARTDSTEVEVVADVWFTLLCQEPGRAALLGATAVVQLAKARQSEDAATA